MSKRSIPAGLGSSTVTVSTCLFSEHDIPSQAIIALYEHPSNKSQAPSSISATMLKTPATGVDCNTSFTLTFPSIPALATLYASMDLNGLPTQASASIRFRRGNILIPQPPYCPKSYTVQWVGKDGKIEKEETKEVSWEGGGWHFQADEVARCVRDGKLQSDVWGWDKSITAMEIFDEVSIWHVLCRVVGHLGPVDAHDRLAFKVRKQGGYKLPEGVEQVV